MIYNKKAFSLVELIVVLSILSILSTIWFYSYVSYSRDSRNSSRILDLSTINKSLNIYETKYWRFPDPSDYTSIIYNSNIIWKQWTIWKSIYNILKLDNLPLDPLTSNLYSFSVNVNNNRYEIWTISEWNLYFTNKINLNETYANNNLLTHISWNYNWKVLTNFYKENIKIFSMPSISISDIKYTDLNDIYNKKLFSYNWCKKLPYTYIDFSQDEENSLYIPKKILLYDWKYNDLNNNINIQKQLISNFVESYSWTIYQNDNSIKDLINTNLNDVNFPNNFNKFTNIFMYKNNY